MCAPLGSRAGAGRLESEHAVTAANLFPYCWPCHGLVLLKRHDPLAFTRGELGQLLDLAQAWLRRAQAAHPGAAHPLLLWNALHRAGASQAHGHLHVMLSQARARCGLLPRPAPSSGPLSRSRAGCDWRRTAVQVPFPVGLATAAAADRHRTAHGGASLADDELAAHQSAGLSREHMTPEGRRAPARLASPAGWAVPEPASRSERLPACRAVAWADLAPQKDMAVCVRGSSLVCPAFQELLWACLRALLDQLGMQCFNLAVAGPGLRQPSHPGDAAGDVGISARCPPPHMGSAVPECTAAP